MKKIAFFALCFLTLFAAPQISAMLPSHDCELIAACQNGDEKRFKQLLSMNIAGEETLKKGLLAAVSAETKANKITKLLLDAKTDPDLIDGLGRSLLELAALSNNKEVLNLLFEAKADPNLHTHNPQARESLQQAVETGSLETIGKFMAAGVDITNGLTYAQANLDFYLSIEENPAYHGTTLKQIQKEIPREREKVLFFENIEKYVARRAAAQAEAAGRQKNREEKEEEDAPPKYEESPNFGIAQEDSGWL